MGVGGKMVEPVVSGGRNIYGEVLGVILPDSVFPRIPGDAGNATTYNFPVRIKVMKEVGKRWGTFEKLVNGDPELLQKYIQAAQELESEGVRAIVSSCGFNIIFQKQVANAVKIPVFLSSLVQIPLVHMILKKEQRIGVITANSRLLTLEFLKRAGIDSLILQSILIAGMQDEPSWLPSGSSAKPPYNLDTEKLEKAMVKVAKQLIADNPNVGALIFECHNMPPYAAAVQEATGLPIFDAQTLAKIAYNAVLQQRYTGFL